MTREPVPRMLLQLFAGEKTERATPRRREEARKKGQVAKSNEIVTVVVLTMAFLAMQMWIPQMALEFQRLFTDLLRFAREEGTLRDVVQMTLYSLYSLAKMVAPVFLAALLGGYGANVMQIGFLYSTEPLKPDLGRLNPVKGLQRVFSKRAVAELIKAVLKTCLVGYFAFSYFWRELDSLTVLMDSPLRSSMEVIGRVAFGASWRVILVLLFLALLDYAYQIYEYEQSLKMSKQEVREEFKNIEGDPQLKAKIREKQRNLATRRMMQEVPKSTVVITNPTHLAVALKYEDGMNAPMVVAKGQDSLAERIKELAIRHDVAIVENKPLARVLYKKVEVGMYIPVELYQAVAEVIAFVYRLKSRR